MNNSRRPVLQDVGTAAVLLLIATLVRYVYHSDYLENVPYAIHPLNDAKTYWDMGLRIFREGWLLPNDGPFYQAPLYPYFLALIHKIGYHHVAGVVLIQAFLGLFNTLLCYSLARAYVSPRLAFLAALLFSLSHYTLFHENKILAETLGLTLLLGFANLFVLWIVRRSLAALLVSAFLLGLATLARPNLLFTFPFLLGFLWIQRRVCDPEKVPFLSTALPPEIDWGKERSESGHLDPRQSPGLSEGWAAPSEPDDIQQQPTAPHPALSQGERVTTTACASGEAFGGEPPSLHKRPLTQPSPRGRGERESPPRGRGEQRHRRDACFTLINMLLFGLVFFLTLLPVTLRNGLVGRDWVPICANSGVTLYMGNNDTAQGGLGSVPGLSNNIVDQHTESIALASQLAGQPLKPSEASNFWVKKTIVWVWENPVRFMTLEFKKILWSLYFIPPAVNYSIHFERELTRISQLPFIAITLLVVTVAWFGVFLLIQHATPQKWFLLSMFGGYFLLSLVYYASDRFLAGIAPFLCIVAVSIWSERFEWKMKSQPLILAIGLLGAFCLAMNPWLDWNAHREVGMGWYNLGVMQEAGGDREQAAGSYEKGIASYPQFPPLLINLGVLYANQNRLEESTRLFERALQLDPNNPVLQRNLEINRMRMGRTTP